MSKRFNRLPSEILRIEDDYAAYCFDEAINEIIVRIEHGGQPKLENFNRDSKQMNPGLKLLLG